MEKSVGHRHSFLCRLQEFDYDVYFLHRIYSISEFQQKRKIKYRYTAWNNSVSGSRICRACNGFDFHPRNSKFLHFLRTTTQQQGNLTTDLFCFQAMISSLCEYSAHPLLSVTAQVASASLFKNCLYRFRSVLTVHPQGYF